jgi:hypothetical protein
MGQVMMSQRFNLFNVGFNASLPGLYFSKQKFKETFPPHTDSEVQNLISTYFQNFDLDKKDNHTHLASALDLANHFDITDLNIPETSTDYFIWLDELVAEIEMKFPLSRIEHYYFLYPRKVVELIISLGLIKVVVDLQLHCKQNLDLSSHLKSKIKDCEFIVFKLMAPAALLSSEPGQKCFNDLYKQIVDAIQPFKGLQIENMSVDQLLKTKSDVDNFSDMLMKGCAECAEALNYLRS